MRKKKSPETKRKEKLWKLVAQFIKDRDSLEAGFERGSKKGYCIDCGLYCEGSSMHAGHFFPKSCSGARLKYHPHNINSQRGGCNVGYAQERVKIAYTAAMIKKYGIGIIDWFNKLKNLYMKRDKLYYETLISLYEKGYSPETEKEILEYLEKDIHR